MKSRIGNLLTAVVIGWSLFGVALPISAADRANGTRQGSRAVRGYYCGQRSGNRSGDFYFRAPSGVRMFNMAFGLESGNATLIGFKFDEMAFGNEYLIRYRSSDGGGDGYIETITATGRKKVTAPCPVE